MTTGTIKTIQINVSVVYMAKNQNYFRYCEPLNWNMMSEFWNPNLKHLLFLHVPSNCFNEITYCTHCTSLLN